MILHKSVTYEKEYMDTMDRLAQENGHLRSFRYFLNQAGSWCSEENRKKKRPKVVVLGPGIPEELIWAAGATPYWILGGSLASCVWSDEMVPRDTDPVSRSLLGYLHQPTGVDFSDALFIVPVSCDSMRKIANLLYEDGRKVFVVDIPPQRLDPYAEEKWKEQMIKMTEAVSKHVRGRVSVKSLKEAAKKILLARRLLKNFLDVSCECRDVISGTGKIFVQNSYYYVENLEEWSIAMRNLTEELKIRECADESNVRPQILLMGSPIYFPNYKIPFLIQEAGLSIAATADVTSMKIYDMPSLRRIKFDREAWIGEIASAWYRNDGSPAYAKNEALYRHVCQLLEEQRTDGVIYCVLKGQIEYDFELERFEQMFESQGMAVFRLETDYQYQDVEQLRIRIEAFSEMLTQKCLEEEKRIP